MGFSRVDPEIDPKRREEINWKHVKDESTRRSAGIFARYQREKYKLKLQEKVAKRGTGAQEERQKSVMGGG
jgi:hypothetical protein